MPLVARGTSTTVQAYVRDAAEQPQVCPDLSLTIYDPLAAPLAGFPVVEPPIVADGVGLYHYVWAVDIAAALGMYTATWTGTVAGLLVTGNEQWEVVAGGSISTGPATFIVPADYDAIRHLLGVTDLDLPDEVIESLAFVQHIELRIKTSVPDWSELTIGGVPWNYLKTATVYGTAALIAESYGKGGMVSLAHGPGTGVRTAQDWDNLAAVLWSYFPKLVTAAEGEPPADMPTMYDFQLVRKSGPTSAAIAVVERSSMAATSVHGGYADWWSNWWLMNDPIFLAGVLPR